MNDIGPFFGATNVLPYPSLDPRYRSTLVARAGELSGPSFEGGARAFDTIVLGGLTAGALDILDAFVVTAISGGTPMRVLHAIASGVLGRAAYEGGLPAAALGLALHFGIATGVATTFYLASLKMPALFAAPGVVRIAVRAGRVGVHVPGRLAGHLRAAVCRPRVSSVGQPARHSHVRRRPADRAHRGSLRSPLTGTIRRLRGSDLIQPLMTQMSQMEIHDTRAQRDCANSRSGSRAARSAAW